MFNSLPYLNKSEIKKGYTLIELLIVIMIIALVFSVGTASFRGYQRRQFVEAKTRDILADIRLAQENAVAGKVDQCGSGTYGRFVGYTISTDNTGTFYELNAACLDEPPPNNYEVIPIKRVDLPDNLSIEIRGRPGRTDILFEPPRFNLTNNTLPGGTNQNNAACVFLRDDSSVLKRIRISPTGVITTDAVSTCS